MQLGQTVVVLGVGPVGQSIIALSAQAGAGQVIGIGEPVDRLAYAKRMGATHVIGLDLPPTDRVAEVRRMTQGRGADIVIEATGAPAAVTQALDLVRDGGRVVVCGQYSDHGDTPINPHRQINRTHVEIRGVWGSDYSHFHRAVEFATHWGDRIPRAEQVSGRYPPERVPQALAACETRRGPTERGGAGGRATGGSGGSSARGGTGNVAGLTACDAPGTCELFAKNCCGGYCDPNAPLSGWQAVNSSKTSELEAQLCQGDIACPGCMSQDNLAYLALCRAGQCTAVDLRKDELSACKSHDECRVRWGSDCCESCGVPNADCLLYTSPSPRDRTRSRMPSSA